MIAEKTQEWTWRSEFMVDAAILLDFIAIKMNELNNNGAMARYDDTQ